VQVEPSESEPVAERDEEVDAHDERAALAHHQHEIGIDRVIRNDAQETPGYGDLVVLVAGRQDVGGQRQRKGQKPQRYIQPVPLPRRKIAGENQVAKQPHRRQERNGDAKQRLFELRPGSRSDQ
jgi:hypothetical protein